MKSAAILLIVWGLTLSCAFNDAQGLAETKSSSFHRMKRVSMESHWNAMIPRGARPQTKCEKEREKALQLVKEGMVGVFVPQCTADGAYEPKQCSGSTGYCWCVYTNGKIIPGTSRGPTEEPPTCNKTRPPTKCEKERAEAIEQGVIGNYIPQCKPDGAYEPRQCWASTGYCWCVDEDGKEIPRTMTPPGHEPPICD